MHDPVHAVLVHLGALYNQDYDTLLMLGHLGERARETCGFLFLFLDGDGDLNLRRLPDGEGKRIGEQM